MFVVFVDLLGQRPFFHSRSMALVDDPTDVCDDSDDDDQTEWAVRLQVGVRFASF